MKNKFRAFENELIYFQVSENLELPLALQGLGGKTYCLVQVPSQFTILHASQVLAVSFSKRCIYL